MKTMGGKIKLTRRIVLCAFGAFVITATVAAGSCYYSVDKKENKTLKKEVVIEAGSKISIEDFFSECPIDARFVSDVSEIDTSIPAIYKLTVFYENAIEEDVTLKIEDHKGPEGRAIPHTVYTTWKMPEAKECVESLYDISGIAKVEYKEGTPSFKSDGSYEVPVVVTDMYGNNTVIKVPFKVINDRTAPVIEGVHDFESDGDQTDLNLLEGITVTDDHDKDPVIRVNDSLVNYEKSGEYEIIYSAMDKAGNISTATAKITVSLDDDDSDEDDDYYYSGSDAYEMASNIMSSLWRNNDVETARAIFDWVHSHVYYQSISFYQTYEEAAYRGFSRRNGDCYVSYACAKMLLDLAGIPNQMVERYPVYTNGHYWNLVKLNGEWYHCDATIFMDHPEVYFMCTDDEIDDYHHSFDGSLYPERAGGSTEYLPEPTPEPTVTPTPAPADVPEIVPVPSEPTVTPAPEITPAPQPETEPTEVPEESAVPAAGSEPEPSEASETVTETEAEITETVAETSEQSTEPSVSELPE